MLKRYLAGALGGLVLAAGTANAQEVTVAIAGNSFALIPLHAAVAAGDFDKVGLKVNVDYIGSGSKAAAAMIGGNADVYIGSTSTVLNGQMQGVDIVAFAAVTTQYTSSVAVSEKWAANHNVTADSPLEEKLKALKGIRLATTGPGDGAESVVRYLAKEAGLDPDRDMTIVGIGSTASAYLAAMEQGMVDAISYSPPLPQMVEKEQNAVILFNNSLGAVDYLDGYFYVAAMARRDWLESNPDAAAKFVAGLQLALDGIRVPEISRQVMAKVGESNFPDLDKEVFQSIWSDLDKMTPPTVEITKPMFERVIEFENLKNEKKTDPATADRFFVTEYIEKGLEIAKSVQ